MQVPEPQEGATAGIEELEGLKSALLIDCWTFMSGVPIEPAGGEDEGM